MFEIRWIQEHEADEVAGLWDRMCRETPDGGPLSESGRRHIASMLAVSAWHHETFCLVAVDGAELVGFVTGRVDPGDGLLPCLAGESNAFYVRPDAHGRGLSRRLATAAVDRLRARDVWTVRNLVCAEDRAAQAFWRSLGFEPDMVCLSLYRSS
jgi:ribosomal protein S18 acetylase RimI-like enzyme